MKFYLNNQEIFFLFKKNNKLENTLKIKKKLFIKNIYDHVNLNLELEADFSYSTIFFKKNFP